MISAILMLMELTSYGFCCKLDFRGTFLDILKVLYQRYNCPFYGEAAGTIDCLSGCTRFLSNSVIRRFKDVVFGVHVASE